MVANAAKFQDVSPDMIELFNGRVIVGLNNSLDFSCMKRQISECGIKFHQGASIELSAILRDDMFTDVYYEEIMAAINPQEVEHSAMADTSVAGEILPLALSFAKQFPERVKSYSQCKIMVHDREPISRSIPG